MIGNLRQLSAISEPTQRLVSAIAVALVVILIVVIGTSQSNDTPQKVFWAAVQNSMQAEAVTVGTTQSASGTHENILNQLDFGQHPSVRALTTLSTGSASAQTETLTTPQAQYTRYNAIRKLVRGKPGNFTSVLGLWAKTTSYSGNVIPPAFSQVVLGQLLPLPLGNLTTSERARMLQQIQAGQVYAIDFSTVKKTTYQGRPAYTYAVSIQPVLYLQLIKNYAPSLDMHQLDQLNPNSYGGQASVSATWTIDAKAKELVRADYGGGRIQTYSGWGIPITTPVPTHTLSATQLQNRLNAVL